MRKLARAPKVKPRRRTVWWVAGGLAALVVVGIAIFATGSPGLAGRGPIPMLAVSPDLKDFGEVRRGAGKLEATFTLQSTGKVPLRISGIVPT